MMFKRMMVLSAVASALVFTGCQERSREKQTGGTAGEQAPPATGGAGTSTGESNVPGSSETMGGTQQGEQQPGTELGGTGGSGTKKGTKKGAMDAGTPGDTDAGTPGGTDAGM